MERDGTRTRVQLSSNKSWGIQSSIFKKWFLFPGKMLGIRLNKVNNFFGRGDDWWNRVAKGN